MQDNDPIICDYCGKEALPNAAQISVCSDGYIRWFCWETGTGSPCCILWEQTYNIKKYWEVRDEILKSRKRV